MGRKPHLEQVAGCGPTSPASAEPAPPRPQVRLRSRRSVGSHTWSGFSAADRFHHGPQHGHGAGHEDGAPLLCLARLAAGLHLGPRCEFVPVEGAEATPGAEPRGVPPVHPGLRCDSVPVDGAKAAPEARAAGGPAGPPRSQVRLRSRRSVGSLTWSGFSAADRFHHGPQHGHGAGHEDGAPLLCLARLAAGLHLGPRCGFVPVEGAEATPGAEPRRPGGPAAAQPVQRRPSRLHQGLGADSSP